MTTCRKCDQTITKVEQAEQHPVFTSGEWQDETGRTECDVLGDHEPGIHGMYPDLIDWQGRLTEAVQECLKRGMTLGDVAEWVSGDLEDASET